MDELTPEQIDAVLVMLREHGIDEFEGLGFRVKFGAQRGHASDEEVVPRREPVGTGWNDPALWPNGTPPTFYKVKK
jgi:hypothetical protein